MGKMTLEDVRAAIGELSDEEKEIIYLDLAMTKEKPDDEILQSHIALLEKRWNDFITGQTKPIPLKQAMDEIDRITDD